MIRINLLPTKKKKKPKPVPTFVVASVIAAVVTAALSSYAVYFMNSRIASLESQKKANAQKLAELEQRMNEVRKFEEMNKTFQERKRIIEELTMNQSVPVRILDEVSRTLTDGVWLVSMKISQMNVDVKGVGFSNADIVTYVQSLKASGLFADVVLHETSRGDIDGVEIYSFSITFAVKV